MRFSLLVAAGFAAAGVVMQAASAAPIAGVGTVQDLINLNQGAVDSTPEGGVVVDGLRYYDFSYSSAGANAPAASQVGVETSPGPVGTSGLEFSFDWTSAGGDNMTSTINYRVHVENPSMGIDQVGLFFNGSVPWDGGPSTFARATETVQTLQGGPVAVLSGMVSGTGPNNQADTQPVVPVLRDLMLSKEIEVRSDPNGIATVSLADNTFRQTAVPEPAALGLVGMAGLMLTRRRTR